MEKRIEVRKMTEQDCIGISNSLRGNLIELSRIISFVDMDDVGRIESYRLIEELSTIILTYGGGIQTPLKLGLIADRMRKPVSMLCSLLESSPYICKANQVACALAYALNNIIEKDILNEDTEVTLNDELFDAPL